MYTWCDSHMLNSSLSRLPLRSARPSRFAPLRSSFTRLYHVIYPSRPGWIQHVMRNHWRPCIYSFGCNEGFDALEENRARIVAATLGLNALELLVNASELPRNSTAISSCPLCQVHFLTHWTALVGRHRKKLALLELPKSGGKITIHDAKVGSEAWPVREAMDQDEVRTSLQGIQPYYQSAVSCH